MTTAARQAATTLRSSLPWMVGASIWQAALAVGVIFNADVIHREAAQLVDHHLDAKILISQFICIFFVDFPGITENQVRWLCPELI